MTKVFEAGACRMAHRAVWTLMALCWIGGVQAAEPQRIVSIGGATTEILYRLGVQDRIVAVDTTSLYPEDVTKKPNVGYMRALSAEGVLAMSPDLILMEEGAGPPEAVGLLKQAGLPLVTIPTGTKAGTLVEKIRAVSTAVAHEDDGELIAVEATRELDALKQDLATVKNRKRVLFIMSLLDGRPMSAGQGTAAHAMIELAGGENALVGVQGYKTLSAEAATALQPDVVLMVNHAGPTATAADVLGLPAFAETPAGMNGAMVTMDGLYLLGFGPRTPQAARDLAEKLYPDLPNGSH